MKLQSKVLILGGNGFIGSNLARRLNNEKKYIVSCFDCAEPKERIEGIHYLTGDFFDDQCLSSMIKEHDIIYHAVSTLTPGNSNERYMQGYTKDFVQSVKLCEYVQKENKKLIFLSSGGTVYGKHEVMPVNEEAFCNPINHYGTVKRCIEVAMSAFRAQNHARMIVARISNPYGPGQDYRKGVGIIDAAIKNAIHKKTLPVWGDGEVVRDYIYIDDVCGMLESLIDYEGEEGIFNLSSGIGYSVNEIIHLVKERYPDLKVDYQPARSVDLKRIVLDNTRIREIYQKTLTSLKEGICLFADEIETSEESFQ